MAILDELHAHRDASVMENLESSMAARLQPIVYIITTAGVNIAGVCKKLEDSCTTILDGQNKDDHFFIMIHDLDIDDDWEDVNNWKKANPNLGVSVAKSFLIKEYNKAKNQPSKAPNFKTKHLNMWVDAPEIWIPTEIWRKNKVETNDYATLFLEKAKEFGAYTATDLSTRIDLSAHIVLTEPDNEGNRYIMPYFFCPKDTIDVRSKEDGVPYRYWSDNGLLIATPGNTIDYDELKAVIRLTNQNYNIVNNEFDAWNASNMVNDLMAEGLSNLSYFSQAISVISHPTKQFEILTYKGQLKHDGNPILEWMLSGCVIIRDPNENIKVHKGRSHAGVKRIDGIIATIMALGGSISVEKENNESQYNNPDNEVSFGV
jgi:phage terminase large subunit-like protein